MKQSFVTEERVIGELKKHIAATLRIDEGSIRPESSIIKDLGAESLDFLDINYRLEQAFGIRMARHFILEHVEEIFGEGAAADEEGRLTPRGLRILEIRLGKHPGLKPGMDVDEASSLVTVKSMARGVMDILDSLPEKCTACARSAWESEEGSHIRCGGCGERAVFATGDDLIKEWLERIREEKKIS